MRQAGLSIEHGVPYETKKLHGKKYFGELLKNSEGMTGYFTLPSNRVSKNWVRSQKQTENRRVRVTAT